MVTSVYANFRWCRYLNGPTAQAEELGSQLTWGGGRGQVYIWLENVFPAFVGVNVELLLPGSADH